MVYTRKQLITCVSIVYLIFVTALAAYALFRINRLTIPISNLLSGFTTALPIVAGLLLRTGYDLTKYQESRQGVSPGQTPRPRLVIIANTIIFIYSSVVITLLGTHVAPASGLNCRLGEVWKRMFSQKYVEGVRAIQDAFNCCGLINSHDMAWPFPDKSHSIHSCESTFGRNEACLGPWRREEQNMAGILMGVIGLVFIWQFAIIATPTQSNTWLHRVLPDSISTLVSEEVQGSSSDSRRAIDYLPRFGNYSDNVAEEVSDDEADGTPQRTIDGGARKVRNLINGAGEEEEDVEGQSALENGWGGI